MPKLNRVITRQEPFFNAVSNELPNGIWNHYNNIAYWRIRSIGISRNYLIIDDGYLANPDEAQR